jgi:hypothetical protein
MDEQAPPEAIPATNPANVAESNASVPARKLTLEVWAQIEADCCNPNDPMSFTDAEKKYGVSNKTISKRANRKHWALPRIIAKAVEKKIEAGLDKVASKWKDRGERHRDVVFDLAHESLKKMKVKAPKNFREAEAADKMARRAAGLEVSEISQQTLIQINDAIDAHVLPVSESGEVVEGEVVDETNPRPEEQAPPSMVPQEQIADASP